ncbi:MAG TPA: hypothetical protein DCX54_05415 [Flavobacteriales bacterium]|nr:hypothetical protein [Flavobacteriales bacterium]
MNLTVVVGNELNWLGIAIFAGMGYLNGYLFRNIGFIKIIALFVFLPFCLNLLIQLNNVLSATIPFLLMALVGFWGPARTLQRLEKLISDVSYYFVYYIRRGR